MSNTAHGTIKVEALGNIIVTKYIGMFNLEGLTTELMKLRAAINALDGQPFAILVDNLELEGGTPEAYEALNEFNLSIANLPLVAKATVITSAVKLSIIEARVTARQQQNKLAFTSKAEALEWLRSELAEHT
jgi:hypothetical protein